MWQSLMDRLPDLPSGFDGAWNALLLFLPDLKVGNLEIRDLVSLLVAALSLILAAYAIKMGRDQGDTTKKQVALAAQLTGIAAKQDQILQEQRAKSARLELRGEMSQTPLGAAMLILPMEVINKGNKGAKGFHWEIFVPAPHTHDLVCVDENGHPVPSINGILLDDGSAWDQWDDFCGDTVFPESSRLAVRLRVKRATTSFEMLWRVRYEDGIMPAVGLAALRFDRDANGFYNATTLPSVIQKP